MNLLFGGPPHPDYCLRPAVDWSQWSRLDCLGLYICVILTFWFLMDRCSFYFRG